MKRCCLSLLLVLLAATLVFAGGVTGPEELEEDLSLETKIATPHKEWARGYAGGEVSALLFVSGGSYGGEWFEPGNRLREVIELAARFDVAPEVVLVGRATPTWGFHGGKLGEQRAERLLAKPHQAIVLAGVPLEKLPLKMQYQILEQVTRGAGLLYCGSDRSDYLVDKRKITPTPTALVAGLPQVEDQVAADIVSAYRLRDGRAAWLKYPAFALTPNTEFSWRGLVDYDYWMLRIGRALWWVAGKTGPLEATVLDGQPAHVQVGDTAAREVARLTNGGPQDLPVTVDLTIRRPLDGATVKLPEVAVTLKAGQPTPVSCALPRLRADEYYLDLIVKSRRGVETCGAGNLWVDSPVGIDQLVLDKTFVEQGQTLTARAVVRGAPAAGSVVRFRFRDSHGRVLRQQDLPVAPEVGCTFQPDPDSTIEIRAEAVLLSGGAEVELKQAAFCVPKRRHGRMNFTQWDTPRDVLGYYTWQKLKSAGWEVCLLGSMGAAPTKQPAVLRASDISLVPYSTRILDPKDDQGYMKPVCWNDEPAVTEYVQKIVDNQALLREQGVFVYSLGDEGVTHGSCVHPACLKAYRGWLKDQYGTLDQLNASWSTSLKSFDEVTVDPKDNLEVAALAKSPARWFDRQAFDRYNLAQFSGRFGKAYLGLDPLSKTGFEGTGGFGDDYDAICDINRFYGPYPSLGDDLVRSIYPRDRVRSNWMGYSKTADALSDAAWRMVMKNMDSVWWWMWDGMGSWRGYIRPTLDFWPATEEVTAEMAPVRRGLGDLLLEAKVEHSGIGIFYSVASALAQRVENAGSFAAAKTTHEMWTDLTYELGLDFRYLTSATLTGGGLTNAEYKVLLLPTDLAVSSAEAAVMRRFVEAGGTLVADVRPGVFDGHCKPLETGVLDDLFGIKRAGRGKAVEVAGSLKGELAGQPLAAELGKVKIDPEVSAAGAKAGAQLDGKPVLLVNQVGRGRTVLLNFQLPAVMDEATLPEVHKLLRALYDLAGAAAPIAVGGPAGEPIRYGETRIWRNGDSLVLGTYRKMTCRWFSPATDTVAGEPVPARLKLPAARHLYDLRAGKYLGKVDAAATRLRWGRASFYAALPYAIGAPQVTLSSATPKPGEALTATIKLGVPATTTARLPVFVEVLDPSGALAPWSGQVVLTAKGQGAARVPIAYDDAPGAWRVRATELFSGRSAEARYTVR